MLEKSDYTKKQELLDKIKEIELIHSVFTVFSMTGFMSGYLQNWDFKVPYNYPKEISNALIYLRSGVSFIKDRDDLRDELILTAIEHIQKYLESEQFNDKKNFEPINEVLTYFTDNFHKHKERLFEKYFGDTFVLKIDKLYKNYNPSKQLNKFLECGIDFSGVDSLWKGKMFKKNDKGDVKLSLYREERAKEYNPFLHRFKITRHLAQPLIDFSGGSTQRKIQIGFMKAAATFIMTDKFITNLKQDSAFKELADLQVKQIVARVMLDFINEEIQKENKGYGPNEASRLQVICESFRLFLDGRHYIPVDITSNEQERLVMKAIINNMEQDDQFKNILENDEYGKTFESPCTLLKSFENYMDGNTDLIKKQVIERYNGYL